MLIKCFFCVCCNEQKTQPIASVFIAMHHNISDIEQIPYGGEILYSSGLKDLCAVFFYTMIGIVVHAVIQEYFLDVRRLLLIFGLNENELVLIFIHLLSFLNTESKDKAPLVEDKAKQVQRVWTAAYFLRCGRLVGC